MRERKERRGAGRRPAPILVAEDDRNIASLVETYLRNAGFTTLSASDGRQALQLLRNSRPALVILDLMLPRVDGWDVCRELRRTSDLPILILSARDEEVDRVLGFSLGADDYVVKPFSPRELVERVKAILRRASGRESAAPAKSGAVESASLERGQLVMDQERHTCTWKGQPVTLTVTEFLILHSLAQRPGVVKSRDSLMDAAYDEQVYVDDRTIDSHIKRLRKKFKMVDNEFDMIETLYGVGYRFRED